jgi:GTP-binding protein
MHIVDTAGIRRQKAVEGFIEQQSVYRSLRSITESDIILFMIDASIGISHQDRRLLDIALEKGKSVIVCLNKVDLIKEKLVDEKTKKEWISDLRATVPWLNHCDLIPISAKYNKHIGRLREVIKKTVLIRNNNISTGKLNRYLYQLLESNPVAIKKAGKRLKVKYASMLKSNPPTFLLFTNLSKDIPDNYKNYLKNGLRKEFRLDNTPIHLIFRTGEDLGKRLAKRMKEIT